ncbi:active breakpoint cluster region-related protein [Ischnura elegans]|uniref:active breakpoint cluster region-related protein n=1 Tax=Ischnura elegans TaxID=197161 RepID=UPI001ED8802C|nr:active breakpoint cluster region-related protein [Ischnura elegans]
MSVFGDFRRVWVQRFPGSDLPAAWEEDVRANLATHKQKVAVLREELEKEEFYVEYLERLLADVEKHKVDNASDPGSSGRGSQICQEKEDVTRNVIQNGEKENQSVGSNLSGQNVISQSSETPTNDSANQCVNELTVSLNDNVAEKADSENSEKTVSDTKEQSRVKKSIPKHVSNYITVIEVNAANNNKGGEKDKGTGKGQGDIGPPKSPHKKVPPLPPPKRFSKLRDKEDSEGASSILEAVDATKPSIPRSAIPDGSESNAKKSDAEDLPSPKDDPQSELSHSRSPGAASIIEESVGSSSCEELKDTDELKSDINPGNGDESSVKSYEDNISQETEEHLYDTVPPDLDGDYVYLSAETVAAAMAAAGTPSSGSVGDAGRITRGGSMGRENESGGSVSDLDGETTIKSLNSLHSGHSSVGSSGGATTDTELHGSLSGLAAHDPHKQSNYVNIDYFIKQKAALNSQERANSVESDEDVPPLLRTISIDQEEEGEEGVDELFGHPNYTPESGDSQLPDMRPMKYASNSSLESSSTPASSRRWERDSSIASEPESGSKAEAERLAMHRCIIMSILESEKVYVECLGVLLQYMKAIKATIGTSQPVISEEEFRTIFYKVPELHSLHSNFLEGLQSCMQHWDGCVSIGEHFCTMASNINIYGAFLHNYGHATDTVRKCSAASHQFAQITTDIRLRSLAGQSLSLEDLLHKPVARVQKNALVLHDLLKYTPETHPDHKTLNKALKMTQNFLDEFNMITARTLFPSQDRAQRRLVKNSFIVELSDGNRKLRHLFLFNDVIACAKYKASGREKFTFELKWYIPLSDIVIFEEAAIEPRESSPANIVALKSQACTVRDQILWEEKHEEKRLRLGSRTEKQRKKLADLEAQLVLASPNLVFRVGNRSSARAYTFFLSSEFERTQWIEAIHALQCSQLPGPNISVSMYELQAWITACRTFLKTNMGSYLMRTGRDESLLVGDLHLTVHGLAAPMEAPADLYVCIEVDSYGHYFRKAKTKLACGSACPVWEEEFIIELEGSQNLRILLYEENSSLPRATLRGKSTQLLSRSWLDERLVTKTVTLQSCVLSVSLKFVPSEVTLRRVPTAKTVGLFGAKIQNVCKRQKRAIPFIITSCVREVERRGMNEVGIYRVSGSASDLSRLKKSFETNSYEAEQFLKEVDVHSVTGILKLYLRELPEALFTDELYPKFFEAFNSTSGAGSGNSSSKRKAALLACFSSLPPLNIDIITYLLAHMIRVNQHEQHNKMSLHNLATVFGPTLLRPGGGGSGGGSRGHSRDPLAAGTVDVMAQAGILHFFLQTYAVGDLGTKGSLNPTGSSTAASGAVSQGSLISGSELK